MLRLERKQSKKTIFHTILTEKQFLKHESIFSRYLLDDMNGSAITCSYVHFYMKYLRRWHEWKLYPFLNHKKDAACNEDNFCHHLMTLRKRYCIWVTNCEYYFSWVTYPRFGFLKLGEECSNENLQRKFGFWIYSRCLNLDDSRNRWWLEDIWKKRIVPL